MTHSAALEEGVNELLRPLGFDRRRRTWNRRRDEVVDVLDIQISKAGDAATLNVGVLDSKVHELCWGDRPPSHVDESSCTVRARVGQLIGDTDLWWDLGRADATDGAVAAVKEHALPFLERMQSRDAMIDHLLAETGGPSGFPPETIYLPILKHLAGAEAEACAMLDALAASLHDAWRERVAEVTARLGCE